MAGAELDPIRRSFGPADLRPLLAAAGVDCTVLVQTVPSVRETREFMDTAAATDFVAGCRRLGRSHRSRRRATRLPSCDPNPDGQRWSAFGTRSMTRTTRTGCCAPRCDAVWRLCETLDWPTTSRPPARATGGAGDGKALPDLRFVIDHIAKPPIASGEIDAVERADGAVPLAASRLLQALGHDHRGRLGRLDARRSQPYVHRAVDIFGPERVMYRLGLAGLPALPDHTARSRVALEEALPPLSPEEWANVFGGNAIRFYGLDVR